MLEGQPGALRAADLGVVRLSLLLDERLRRGGGLVVDLDGAVH